MAESSDETLLAGAASSAGESLLDLVVRSGPSDAALDAASDGGTDAAASGGCGACALGGRGRGSAPAAATTAANAATALAGLTTDTGECAEDVEHAPGSPCASRAMLKIVGAFAAAAAPDSAGGSKPAKAAAPDPAGGPKPLLPSAATPEAEAVRAAAKALRCDSESCVLAHPSLRQFAADNKLAPAGAFAAELDTRFKAEGPRDSTALTSNENIDGTLRRWARVFPDFYPCPYAMMDFERNGDLLGRIDIRDVLAGRAPLDLGPGFGVVRRPARTFGCVLNTDVRSGAGKHWVALFVDCRGGPSAPWTAEYFNSVGNPPPKPVVRWLEATRARLAEYRGAGGEGPRGPVETVAVTEVDHQESQTECGLYAMFYIRRRLEGTPYRFFFDRLVPDEAMTAFRAHVFRAS